MPIFNHVTLHTKRLLLRPLRHADAQAVIAMFTDTRFMEFVTSPLFTSVDEAHALVTRDMGAMAAGERIRLGLERVEDGALVGNCTLFNLDEKSRKTEAWNASASQKKDSCGKAGLPMALCQTALFTAYCEATGRNAMQAGC